MPLYLRMQASGQELRLLAALNFNSTLIALNAPYAGKRPGQTVN